MASNFVEKKLMFLHRKKYFLFLCLFSFALIGCEKVIESGDFNSVAIGQSSAEVLDALIALKNVSSVKPDISDQFLIDKSSLDDIFNLSGSSGIAVQGDVYSMQIHFDKLIVSELILSPSSRGNSFGIKKGMQQKDVLNIVKEIIKAKDTFTAFNFPANSRWVALNSISPKDKTYLESFNVWSYHEDNKLSHTLLIFNKGKLNKIVYSWSPFELP